MGNEASKPPLNVSANLSDPRNNSPYSKGSPSRTDPRRSPATSNGSLAEFEEGVPLSATVLPPQEDRPGLPNTVTGVYPGASGCVIVPSLVLGLKSPDKSKFITKIFGEEKDYVKEKQQNELVIKIDGTSQFTNVKFNENPIDIRKLPEDALSRCSRIFRSRDYKVIKTKKYLNYEYLGQSLYTIISEELSLSNENIKDILNGLSSLASNVYAMNKGRDLGQPLFHNDIHFANIMFNPANKRVYLIDFERSTINVPKIGKDTLVDLYGIVDTVDQFINYVLRKVPGLGALQGKAIVDFKTLVDRIFPSRGPPPPPPKEIREEIVSEIVKLARTFSASGGKRRKTKKGSKKTKKAKKHSRRRKLHR